MAVGRDHQLLDTVRRRLRHPRGWLVVALHLSRLAPPAPRPHHRRIARVLMQDVARRHDGEVFVLGHGDLVLLCLDGAAMPGGPAPDVGVRVATPRALPGVLSRLLRADAPNPAELVSLWSLEAQSDLVLRYAVDAVAAAPRLAIGSSEPLVQMRTAAAAAATLEAADIADLLRRQTAVLFAPDGVWPLFREVRFSMAALEARLPSPAALDADPFLFRHLAERMDQRMLATLQRALGGGGALDAAAAHAAPLHINMTLGALGSVAFAELAREAATRRISIGVEVSVLDACANPERFEAARAALATLHAKLVLDEVSPLAAQLAHVAALRPDLLKLVWSPRLLECGPAMAGAQERLIRELGPERVVLSHAETETALRWGLARGIRRFQGRHVDAMLGASRLTACPASDACTLAQCIERAASVDPAGRAGCRNHPLLDASTDGGMQALRAGVAA